MANLTKDQRLIRDNPKKTPYELKELGLSDKAFTELLAKGSPQEPEKTLEIPKEPEKEVIKPAEPLKAEVSAPEPATPVPAKVNIIPNRAQPVTQPAKPMKVAEGQAHLVEKKSGKRTYMSKASAERWAKKHPGQFDVV